MTKYDQIQDQNVLPKFLFCKQKSATIFFRSEMTPPSPPSEFLRKFIQFWEEERLPFLVPFLVAWFFPFSFPTLNLD